MKGNLKEKLKFPLYGYEKFNGFLGLVSYNFTKAKLHIATKGSASSSYTENLGKMLKDSLTPQNYTRLVHYLRGNDVTLAFEVIDTKADPHIIKSPAGSRCLALLAIIPNEINYTHSTYDELKAFGESYGFLVPKRIYIKDIHELKDFYAKNATDNLYDFDAVHTEGYVFEGADGFTFKYKTPYYVYWKFIRTNVTRYLALANWREVLLVNDKLDEKDKKIIHYIVESYLSTRKKNVNMLEILEDSKFQEFIHTLNTK